MRTAAAMFLLLGVSSVFAADDYDTLKVGVQPDGRIVVPTNQILEPAGTQVSFPGRPVDLLLSDDGKTLVVKNMRDLVFLDLATGKIKQTLALPVKGKPRPGFSVVGLAAVGDRLFASDAQNVLRVAKKKADGAYEWADGIEAPKPAVDGLPHLSGILALDDKTLLLGSTRGNCLLQIDLTTNKVVAQIPTSIAPFQIVKVDDRKCYVTNWGGDVPKKDEPQGTSSKTPIRVDPLTWVANDGTVGVLEKTGDGWKQTKTIRVGLHPSGLTLAPDRKFLYVANANSDNVSVIDTAKDAVVETITCRPEGKLPFGSGSNAVALSPDGGTLYVANGTNNCLAVVQLGKKATAAKGERGDASKILDLIPTGWYPGAIALSADGKKLYVANIKGHGSLAQPKETEDKKNSHQHLGTVSIIDVPDADQLAKYTAAVNRNNRLAYSLAGLDKPRPDAKAAVVPQRHGEPSAIKHVFYVIKENRTYDQVFGDMKEGNGEPKLVLFGEDVTPNHHALAREFTLFDNFYCSGVLSADGHNWVNEAYVTDYLERSFGGFTRSYPDDGTDPLALAASGHLWDNALAHKKTIRNYGEFVSNTFEPKTAKWADFYQDYVNGTTKNKVKSKANVKALEPYTHPGYPWFPLLMPDVYRARIVIDELKDFEKKGGLPNLVYITLPCDHTDGTRENCPTPKAMVADNDLALGQIVEAITNSKFWPESCIFVVEDDPQDGFDHVDAHRTVALVISPYTKRKFVDHTNYNQTGMVKTIELMLELPPMNQLDLSATPMRNCFQAKADLTPYKVKPAKVKLDEMNPPMKDLTGKAKYWAEKSKELDLDEGDAADEDTLNRILWHAMRGYDTPYPEKYSRAERE